jgi:hypothetical protein
MHHPNFAAVLSAAWLLTLPVCAIAQTPAPVSRWEIAALPSLGFDSDEGFGYGAFGEIYRHREGVRPYVWTLQPNIDLSTRGRRDIVAFFDAPHLLPGGWRFDVFAGSERHLATPYFGIGNATVHDAGMDDGDGANPYYYRFGRDRQRAAITFQRPLGATSYRILLGAGASHMTLDDTPYDEGTTLLAAELAANGGALPGGWSNHVRAGVVHDTRDREVGPTSGAWSELLVQRVDGALGSDFGYTRWTATDRRYIPLRTPRLVYANRLLLQGVHGDAPFYDLSVVQTSFKQQEGLGGAKTLRGLPKNRYVGKGMFLWNTELRWRALEFDMLRAPFSVTLSGFIDQGRVWTDRVHIDEVITDLHAGYGGGVRLGMRDNFVVALDVGRSSQTASAMYIGLGYLF